VNIVIKTIPHKEQRYETCGNWWWDEHGDLQIRVSEMGDWRYESLVAFHEQFEALACRRAGIREETVSAFDIEFENNRKQGNEDEPGDDPQSPYYRQHKLADIAERQLAMELGVDWKEYSKAVFSL
jgi:hypothetical protein